MSTVNGNLALLRPTPQPAPEPRRHLEIAPTRAQRRARPRLAHALVTLGGIGVILLAQLLLSFALADGAYVIAGLQDDQRDLLREEQALDEKQEGGDDGHDADDRRQWEAVDEQQDDASGCDDACAGRGGPTCDDGSEGRAAEPLCGVAWTRP